MHSIKKKKPLPFPTLFIDLRRIHNEAVCPVAKTSRECHVHGHTDSDSLYIYIYTIRTHVYKRTMADRLRYRHIFFSILGFFRIIHDRSATWGGISVGAEESAWRRPNSGQSNRCPNKRAQKIASASQKVRVQRTYILINEWWSRPTKRAFEKLPL